MLCFLNKYGHKFSIFFWAKSLISYIWSTEYILAPVGANSAIAAVKNPDPVPISKIFLALKRLSYKWTKVFACIIGAEIVVFHPIDFGESV